MFSFDTKEVMVFGEKKPVTMIKPTPENLSLLGKYVQQKLLEAKFPKDEANPDNPHSRACHVVSDVWRQSNELSEIEKNLEFYLGLAIKFPPPPISSKRFSLEAFISLK